MGKIADEISDLNTACIANGFTAMYLILSMVPGCWALPLSMLNLMGMPLPRQQRQLKMIFEKSKRESLGFLILQKGSTNYIDDYMIIYARIQVSS